MSDPGEWTCTSCTFINSGFLNECEMCEHRRPTAGSLAYMEQANPQQSYGFPTAASPPQRADDTLGGSAERQNDISMASETTVQTEAKGILDSEPPQTEDTEVLKPQSLSMPGEVSMSEGSNPGSHMESSADQDRPQDETPVSMDTSPQTTDYSFVQIVESLEEAPAQQGASLEETPAQQDAILAMPARALSDDDASNGWSFLQNEVRIVLIGKTGVGKSTTGNNILDSQTFKSSASGASITKKCQLGWGTRFTRDLQIIDTPGLFDTGLSNEEICREVVKCIGMTSPGPHAFVLVIRLDRFTAEEKATVDHFLNIFGKDMLKYLIVLFTRKDDLKYDGITVDEYVHNVPGDLKDLLQSCDNRYLGFDNRGTPEERSQDVQDLLKMVDTMVKTNGGGHYTNEMYEEAERIITEQEEELIKASREKMKLEMQKLRQEVEEELRAKEEKRMRQIEEMRGKLSELGVTQCDDEWVDVFGEEALSSMTVEVGGQLESLNQGPPSFRGQNGNSSLTRNGLAQLQNEIQVQTSRGDETEALKVFLGRERPMENGQSLNGARFETDSCRAIGRRVLEVNSIPTEQPASLFPSEAADKTQENERLKFETAMLRETVEQIRRDHMEEQQRMLDEFEAQKQTAQRDFQREQQRQRQEVRQEISNPKSGIFARIFGALKSAWKSVTGPISKALSCGLGYASNRH